MRKYRALLSETHTLMKKLLDKLFGNTILRSTFGTVENLIFNLFLATQVIFNEMSFANFSMFLSALQSLSGNIASIANGVVELAENSAYMNIYREFVNTKNVIAVEGKGISAEDIKVKEPIFSLENVSFSYPGSNELILKHINIELEKGKFYVIVGANGEGKTTLTRLLCRLYDVSEGRILYNGTDIRDIEYKSYRNGIGIVFQDYKYYNLSIAENVATNSYDESDDVRERIYSCLCAAGLKSKIDSLPKGIDTQLGKIFDEEGIILSGGEVQKLALARMLFNNPDIVFLTSPPVHWTRLLKTI